MIALPNPYFIKNINNLKYDKNKSKLYILNSFNNLDYSLLNINLKE